MATKKLEVTLSGRLDTTNTAEWFEKVSALIRDQSAEELVIDCEGLEYISSTGLRALITVVKSGCRVHCFGVSPTVYDIFEVTGLNTLMDVQKAFRRIHLDDSALIAKGTVGMIYRLDEDRVVKVFNQKVTIDIIRRERKYAQKVLLSGIPTVISYDIVQVDDCYGIIFEMAGAEEFSRKLDRTPGMFDELAARYAGLLKQINQTPVGKGDLPEAKEIYHGYVDASSAFLSGAEKEALHGLIDSVPDRDTMLHGDYHANNVMYREDELMLIDLGDVSRGHPIFDLAGMYVSHILVGSYQPAFIKAGMGIDTDVCRRLWDRFLRLYFPDETEIGLKRKEDLIRRFAHLKLAIMYAIAPGLENYLTWKPLEDARAVLFPGLEALKADLEKDDLC